MILVQRLHGATCSLHIRDSVSPMLLSDDWEIPKVFQKVTIALFFQLVIGNASGTGDLWIFLVVVGRADLKCDVISLFTGDKWPGFLR